jgi:threonine synthase
MDVGNPSNFIRILEIFHHQFPELKNKLSSYSITDEETVNTIREVYEQYGYTADPHGAVGYLALKRWLAGQPGAKGLFLETAHPVKFPDAIEKHIGKKIDWPASVAGIMNSKKVSTKMQPRYEALKNYLLD